MKQYTNEELETLNLISLRNALYEKLKETCEELENIEGYDHNSFNSKLDNALSSQELIELYNKE